MERVAPSRINTTPPSTLAEHVEEGVERPSGARGQKGAQEIDIFMTVHEWSCIHELGAAVVIGTNLAQACAPHHFIMHVGYMRLHPFLEDYGYLKVVGGAGVIPSLVESLIHVFALPHNLLLRLREEH